MSSELEQRLQRALAEVVPGESAGDQAREAALAAMPHSMRRRHRLVLVLAAVVAVLVLAGAALAASRTARETVGLDSGQRQAARHRPLPLRPLPPGSAGFAAFGGGRLWLASPGISAEGRRFAAVELSPGALNMAIGTGRRLEVLRMADGSLAWSHPAGGHVVAAAWSPFGTEIAYVVQRGGGYQLRMIEGDGDHDRLLAGHVSPVAPAWRADSLGVAYVDAHGRVAVNDLAAGRTTASALPRGCGGTVVQVAFAPAGRHLAADLRDGTVALFDRGAHWFACMSTAPGPPIGTAFSNGRLVWISSRTLIASAYATLTRMDVSGHAVREVAQWTTPAWVNGLALSPDHRQLALGLQTGDDRLQIVTTRLPGPAAKRLRLTSVVRTVPDAAATYRLIWR
ncbi:MAG: TolB protein [Gaiellales bacterium]|jgi:hypothetical protein|nr:TolB protein [Gaiellales bacterium]